MKLIYLIRHAERDPNGVLSEKGKKDAKKIAETMPFFDKVYSSGSNRTKQTARILTGREPDLDERAGFYMAPQEKSDAINKIYKDKDVDFLEAIKIYDDKEVLDGISKQADRLNQMIDEILDNSAGRALIVSHNITMCPAMETRGLNTSILNYLAGFIIYENKDVSGLSHLI